MDATFEVEYPDKNTVSYNAQIRGRLDATICARDGTLVCFGNLSI